MYNKQFMPLINDINLYRITIVLFVIITVFLGWRLTVWHTTGFAGISYEPGVGEIAEIDGEETIEFTHTSIISRLQRESPAARAGLKQRDTVLSVNGIPSIEGELLRELERRVAAGDTVTYVVKRGDTRETFQVVLESPLINTQYVINLVTTIVISLVFFGIGLFILRKKSGDQRVRIFFFVCLSTGVLLLWASMIIPETMLGTGTLGNVYLYGVVWLSGIFLSYFAMVLLVHFSLIFPFERPLQRKHPYLLSWMYVPPGILCSILFLSLLTGYLYVLFVPDFEVLSTYDLGRMAALANINFPLSQSTFFISLALFGISVTGTWVHVYGIVKSVKRHLFIKGLLHAPGQLVLLFYSVLGSLITLALIGLYIFRPDAEISLLAISPPMLLILLPIAILLLLLVVSAVGFPIFILVNLYLSYRDSDTEAKRQIRWPLWGIGTALFGSLAFSVPILIDEFMIASISRIFYYSFDVLRLLIYALIPVSIVIAIIKYRLMDIDIIIKKTVTYSIVSVIVVAFYLILVLWIGGYIIAALDIQTYWVTVTATVAIAAAFIPLRNRVQRIIDRRFHKKKLDHSVTLEEMRQAIGKATSTGAIERTILEYLQPTLQSRTIFIAQFQNELSPMPVSATLGLPDDFTQLTVTNGDYQALDRIEKPVSVTELTLSDPLRIQLKKLRCEIVAKTTFKNETAALIGIGRKLSDFPFDEDDIDFIVQAADEFSRAKLEVQLREREVDYSKAIEIQQALLPRTIPQIEKCNIAASWNPARAVAGDYYDTIQINNHTVAVCIADVVGKGMPAALLMSNLQSLVRAFAADSMPPAELCNKINNVLGRNIPKGKFITFCIGIIDTERMEMLFTNAGHNRPILKRSDGTLITLRDAGPGLGIVPSHQYKQSTVSLHSGDFIIFYTDGITEAMNHRREEFGEDRFSAILSDTSLTNAGALHDKIVSEVKTFSQNDLSDDVTLMIVELK